MLGEWASIPSQQAHVLLDRDGKTLSHAFIEAHPHDVRETLAMCRNKVLGTGKRARRVTITTSSQDELLHQVEFQFALLRVYVFMVVPNPALSSMAGQIHGLPPFHLSSSTPPNAPLARQWNTPTRPAGDSSETHSAPRRERLHNLSKHLSNLECNLTFILVASAATSRIPHFRTAP